MLAIDKAISAVGGLTKFSELLGLSPQRVSNWRVRGVPVEFCPVIEAVTDGAVLAEELRPDVPWHVLRGESHPRPSAEYP